jgi:phage portal protein BeeE
MLKRLMNWWKRSVEYPTVPLAQAYNYLTHGIESTSGVQVNQVTVLGYPAVWRGVNLIASKLAVLPLNVYKDTRDGGRVEDANHPCLVAVKKKAI